MSKAEIKNLICCCCTGQCFHPHACESRTIVLHIIVSAMKTMFGRTSWSILTTSLLLASPPCQMGSFSLPLPKAASRKVLGFRGLAWGSRFRVRCLKFCWGELGSLVCRVDVPVASSGQFGNPIRGSGCFLDQSHVVIVGPPRAQGY